MIVYQHFIRMILVVPRECPDSISRQKFLFIQHPRQVHNDTAMPEMGVTDQDARDVAAYLYQFK